MPSTPVLIDEISLLVSGFGSNARQVRASLLTLEPRHAHFRCRTFLHAGATCAFQLPAPGRGLLSVEGVVVECVHSDGLQHRARIRLEPMLPHETVAAIVEHTRKAAVPPALRSLVVDDHLAHRRLLEQTLPSKGVTVKAVGTIDEAKAALGSERFDVLVLDHHLANLTGLEALEQLVPEHFSGPIVFFTADTTACVHASLVQAGASCVLVKPAHSALIASTLRTVVAGNSIAAMPQSTAATLGETAAGKAFVADLRQVRTLLNAQAPEAGTVDACRGIAATAGAFGLWLLARSADRAALALELGVPMGSAPVTDLAHSIDTLLASAAKAA